MDGIADLHKSADGFELVVGAASAGGVQALTTLALGIGLPVAELASLLRETVGGEPAEPRYVSLDAVNRRGQPLRCRVGVRRLTSHPAANVVAIIEGVPESPP